jgi:TolB-like protein
VTIERLAAALAVAVLGAAPLAAQCPDGTPPPCAGARPAAPPVNSVAVLYFESRSTDTNDLALADGLTEEIINRLSGIERLTVRSRYLVWRYRGAAVDDPAAVARGLNVAYLVSGTVRRSGERLRVSAELIRAASGAQVWGRQYDQPAGDAFAIQETVAQEVATGIMGRLLPAESRTIAARPTASAEAYNAYTLGRFFWSKRTAADLVRAAEYFRLAIRLDSGYAQAWSGLADSYVLFDEYDVPGINPDSILTLAEPAARRAIARAPRLGEAYVSLGMILVKRNRGQEALRAFEQGVALSPQYPTAHHWYGNYLWTHGRWEDGVRELVRAKELDPTSLVITLSLAYAYNWDARWVEAEAMADQLRALDPGDRRTIVFDLLHDVSHRHLERIPRDVRRVMQASGVDTAVGQDLERRLGDPALRSAAIRDIAAGAGAMPGSLRNPSFLGFALLLAYEGDDAALAFLDAFVGTPRAADLESSSVYGVLGPRRRADPRFQAALARLGIPRP